MKELDLSGLKCPLPVLKTQKALSDLTTGQCLRVISTDPMSQIDIPHFCSEKGHILLDTQPVGEQALQFDIKKG